MANNKQQNAFITQHIQSHEATAADTCDQFHLRTHVKCFRPFEECHESQYGAEQVKLIAYLHNHQDFCDKAMNIQDIITDIVACNINRR